MFFPLGTGHKIQGGGEQENLFKWRWFFVDPPLEKG